MDAGVAKHVFGEAFHLVNRFGGVSVADEFGIQIARVIWRLQGEPEIVHGENIFQKFGFLKVANAAGLARGIEPVSHGVGASVEIVIVHRLIDAHAPQDNAGMIPVSADHAADVIDRNQFPGLISNMLPAREFLRAPAALSGRRHPENAGTADSAKCGRYCT